MLVSISMYYTNALLPDAGKLSQPAYELLNFIFCPTTRLGVFFSLSLEPRSLALFAMKRMCRTTSNTSYYMRMPHPQQTSGAVLVVVLIAVLQRQHCNEDNDDNVVYTHSCRVSSAVQFPHAHII